MWWLYSACIIFFRRHHLVRGVETTNDSGGQGQESVYLQVRVLAFILSFLFRLVCRPSSHPHPPILFSISHELRTPLHGVRPIVTLVLPVTHELTLSRL